VPTGFPSLDKMLGGGARKGDLILLGGDVGSGKSCLALAIALRVAETARRAFFLTSEMTADRILERALAIEGRARIDDLRAGELDEETRAAVGAAAVRLRDWPLVVERLETPTSVADVAERIAAVREPELVVIDSLQAFATGTRGRDEELAAAVHALKTVALDKNVALLVAAHLPGLAANGGPRRPTLDDFGALGAPKQHADVILGLFREEMYPAANGVEGATELLVLKNRNGPAGYADLYFYKAWMRFEDMLDPDR
jgi:replicative DNA helicase